MSSDLTLHVRRAPKSDPYGDVAPKLPKKGDAMSNLYDVERSWPDYFLEHRERTVEQQGTYRCGDLPVWTVYCPNGYLGNSTIIEGDDGLIVYDRRQSRRRRRRRRGDREDLGQAGARNLLLTPPHRPLQRRVRDCRSR